ncbi:MAG: NADPH-dependent F420 reductase [Chloroflexi bacterium]|nr:NADPH-dependent F420 reductase [Chloroflexota bacterium]
MPEGACKATEMAIGIIGGTGPEGRGLALRFASAGEAVVIGSRDQQRAKDAAATLMRDMAGSGASVGGGSIGGAANADAAESEIVVIAVPYKAQAELLESLGARLDGKPVINVIAPVEMAGGKARLIRPPAGSAAEEAAALVPRARWVAGFHTLPARDLLRIGARMETDALICGDEPEAKRTVVALAAKIPGLRPVDAGALECARYLEGATALLVNINRIYKAHASIRVQGLQA